MADEFKPNLAGTLLPDGSRWGPFTSADVADESGILASPDVEVIVSGIRWSEGPVWNATEEALYFVDTIDARIYRWTAQEGTQIIASQAGGFDGGNVPNFDALFEPGANGMALVGDDIVICQHPTRRVIRMKLCELRQLKGRPICEANFEVLAQAAPSGRPLNAPNDVIVASNGDIYFTDPVYGFLLKQPPELGYAYVNFEKGEHPDQAYLDEAVLERGAGCTGVYRVRAGVVELVTDLLERPNGLALSVDGRVLWVANSVKDTPSWHAFELGEELPLERSSLLTEAELGPGVQLGPGLSDGFKVDEHGRLWSSVPGGIAVIDPGRGKVLASIKFSTNISNVRFGDGGDVFVTGLGHVWRLRRRL
uniref:SMP-30/Gluconolactonase/LRE-like region domain-containing protein n=1 Tax=Zooxanthella nutricula TaxID=1333877 RepID=A0A6U6RLD3_9DINO|mmetsp:Transcript_72078/g.220652  ORF Transcript_72078/g.220652 Transcript_72078/m.220652 type:complete len:365 (+) Transcript_72078:114-1208(+)